MKSMTCREWGRAGIVFTLFVSLSISAAAEEAAVEISVEDRAKAADAYDQGTSAYLGGRYELAAHWFERAYRLVPNSAALLQAIRAQSKAGNVIRAANLGMLMKERYPTDTRGMSTAREAIEAAKPVAVLVVPTCDKECTLELDGAVIQYETFFVSAEIDHVLKGGFDTGETTVLVSGDAGTTERVSLVAPLPPPPPPIPRWAFFSSLGATVALGAVTVWSGIDANNGVNAFEAAARTASSPGINDSGSPTPAEEAEALLDNGRKRERRTNVLIGVTAGMAASTAVLGIFTNWKKESREPSAKHIEPAVGVTNRGGAFTLKGRF